MPPTRPVRGNPDGPLGVAHPEMRRRAPVTGRWPIFYAAAIAIAALMLYLVFKRKDWL